MSTPLIIALDFDTRWEALSLIERLNPNQCALKVGSELFTSLGPDFVRELVQKQFKVFLDLKFFDIPNTVARACKVSADLGVWMVNVHASGGMNMMIAAKKALENYNSPPLLIAVTVLTSMDQSVLSSIGILSPMDAQVLHLAQMAQASGLDGVVCSAHEAAMIKSHCGPTFLAITPGIRMPKQAMDDQSRTTIPKHAIQAGSDYLVIGRSITRDPDPVKSVADILSSISIDDEKP